MLIESFFIALVLLNANAGVALTADNSSPERDRQIVELSREGNCYDAGKIVAEEIIAIAEAIDKDIPYLPRWHYQIVECMKGNWKAPGVPIIEYFNLQLDRFSDKKACQKAEAYLNSIDERYKQLQSRVGYMGWRYRVARCYESTDRVKSIRLYAQLTKEFPDSRAAIEAQFRRNYLIGDRSWIVPKPNLIIEAVKKGLHQKDVKALERYASKSFFLYGFEGQLRPAFFDEDFRQFFTKKFNTSTFTIGQMEVRRKDFYLLPVTFPDEEYPFFYFMFEDLDGGWQWTGIMISNVARDQPPLTPRM